MPYILEVLGVEHDNAFERYRPRPYRGDVVLFRASKQLPGLVADDRHLGWKDVLHGNLDVCDVPGHQQNILIEPNVAHLADQLSTRLQAAQQRHGQDATSIAVFCAKHPKSGLEPARSQLFTSPLLGLKGKLPSQFTEKLWHSVQNNFTLLLVSVHRRYGNLIEIPSGIPIANNTWEGTQRK